MLTYRPDIDGLRAVAIVPVLAFHAELGGMTGGFVGVDVFFVISGYLITSLILDEHDRGTFSFWGFLERRARRLVPAIIPVIICVWIFGWLYFLPDPFAELSKNIAYLTVFAANHYALENSGYFDAGDSALLLHTWSLSVEEQFYLLFSLTLLATLRFGRWWVEAIIVVAASASLACAIVLIHLDQTAEAFFLTPARLWELLIGAWLALGRLAPAGRVAAQALPNLGLGLIAVAVFAFDSETPFPGLAALIPTIGAALVIHAGGVSSAPVHRVLASRPAVYLGRISYSLYLWHWPLLIAAGKFSHVLPFWYPVATLALSLAIAALSYHFIEQPFRRRVWLPTRRSVLVATASVGAALVLVALVFDQSGGWPSRLPVEVRQLIDYGPQTAVSRMNDCSNIEHARQGNFCAIGALERKTVDFVVWGDSHARSLFQLIDDEARDKGLRGAVMSLPGCPPGIASQSPKYWNRQCVEWNKLGEQYIRQNKIAYVVLDGFWISYANVGDDHWYTPLVELAANLPSDTKVVWIIDPVPTYNSSVPEALASHYLFEIPLKHFVQSRADYLAANRVVIEKFDRLDGSNDGRVRRITTVDSLCPHQICRLTDDNGRALYIDKDHLSDWGAALLKPALAGAFDEMARAVDGR